MNRISRIFTSILLGAIALSAAPIGKISYLEGEAYIQVKGKEKPLRVSQKIDAGDLIRTGEESIVEVTYDRGTVVRIGEKSKVSLKGDEAGVEVKEGKVWANVQKLANGQFRVTTPVATAAVRGTVFRVDAEADSSSTIALYEGIVDVGPADTTKIKEKPKATGWGPPVQVAGPYEVTMEDWIRLDPGSQINVKPTGKYATTGIDAAKEARVQWILFNQQRDKDVQR